MADTSAAARLLAALLVCGALLVDTARAQENQAPQSSAGPAQPNSGPAQSNSGTAHGTRRPDRVYMKDLEGTWVAREYIDRLRTSKSPHDAARKAAGIVIKIQREGRSYPILITNFQRAVLQAVIDVQPGTKPKTYRLAVAQEDRGLISASDLSFIPFRGERAPDGTFKTLSISEPNFAKKRYLTYVRLSDPLETFVNRTVLAGKYTDAEGKAYAFSEDGEALLPDRKFAYEISLDPSAADCDLIQSHKERDPEGTQRIGFRWAGKQLRLYEVSGTKAPYKCAAKPFAMLAPQ